MVQLQRRFAYRYKSKHKATDHFKFQLTLPEEFVKALGWREGDEIEPKLSADSKSIVLSKLNQKKKGEGKANSKQTTEGS